MSDRVHVSYSEHLGPLRPDGWFTTTGRWMYNSDRSWWINLRMWLLSKLIGQDGVIYNVEVDCTDWPAFTGPDAFGEGRIIHARIPGRRIWLVDNAWQKKPLRHEFPLESSGFIKFSDNQWQAPPKDGA